MSKLGLIAQSCMIPGYSTMISNMISSLSFLETENFEQTYEHYHPQQVRTYFEGASREMYVVMLSLSYLNLTFAEAAQKAFDHSNGSVTLMAVELKLDQVKHRRYGRRHNDDDGQQHLVHEDSRVLLNPGTLLRMAHQMKVYALADDLESIIRFGICDRPEHEDIPDIVSDDGVVDLEGGQQRQPSREVNANDVDFTVLSKEEEMLKTMGLEVDHDVYGDSLAADAGSQYHKVETPNASLLSPLQGSRLLEHGTSGEHHEIDTPLVDVALKYHFPTAAITPGMNMTDRMALSLSSAANAHHHHHDPKIEHHSIIHLSPPTLDVLRNKSHIVICRFVTSFLSLEDIS